MKLTLLLLLASSLSLLAESSYSQSTKLNLNLEDVTVEEALENIENQSEFYFLYSRKVINVNRKVSINTDGQKIRATLDLLFNGTDVDYKIKDKIIVLTTPEIVGSFNKINSIKYEKQETIIKGKITDSGGNPLPGVNIIEKGTTNGTISNVEGEYSISVSSENATLIFSYVGFLTEEVNITGNTIVDVVLVEDIQSLEEVVVVGYGERAKETLTGSISSIRFKDIQRSQATTTSGSLVGKIAGINSRMSDGRPGNSTTIQIRNMGTPLYVIDGVQKDEGQFNNIDFNDIESISILKDASAAIYGVRAANGVVVVTTKKGKKNTPNVINLNTYYGWQKMFRFPKPASAETYVKSYIQSDAITGSTPKYTLEDLEKWKEGTETGYRSFDWYDYILLTAPQSYIGVNTSGGSEKINYYIALSHLDQQAAIKSYGGFYRTNIQFNLDANISKKLKVGGSVNGRIEERKHPGVPGSDDTWQALFAIYRNLPTVRPFANDNPDYPALTSSSGQNNFGMLNYETSGSYEKVWKVMQLNLNGEYEILEGLKVKGLFGYYFAQEWMDNQEYTYKLYDYDEETEEYSVVFNMDNPYRERNIANVEEVTSQIQLTYDKKVDQHGINFIVGAETYNRKTPSIYVHSVPSSNTLNLIDFEEMDTYNDYGDETEARLGYIGRLNYNYAQKYLFEVSARYDGSWKFPKEDRWGFFPSASIGWRISEENFWTSNSISNIISDLKLRASYGLLGDDALSDYGYNAFDYLSGYNYDSGGAVLDGEYYTGASSRGLPVLSISWLEAKILDIGTDFGLLNNKLTGSLDYFVRERDGLPASRYDVLIPAEVGFSLPNENLESDRTVGMDGGLSWHHSVGDFNYSLGGTFTYARKYDWHQYKPRFSSSWNEYRNSINERYASISWGYHCIGQFQSWEEIENYSVDIDGVGNTTLRPGDLIYEDENGDGIITGLDARPIGYPQGTTPIFNFGLTFSCNWKGIDFAIDFAGASGYSYQYAYESKLPFHDGGNNPAYYMENQWHLSDPSDPNSELIPGKYPTLLVGNSGHSNYWTSDFWMVNGRYMKLKNLEIGYSLPSNLINKILVKKLRVYAMGQNLFSFDNLNEIDPEITTGSGLQYPTNRVISVGLNVTF